MFCGRILLFLAKFFPFSERSGLNIISEFNLDNVTAYNTDSSAYDDDESAAGGGGRRAAELCISSSNEDGARGGAEQQGAPEVRLPRLLHPQRLGRGLQPGNGVAAGG